MTLLSQPSSVPDWVRDAVFYQIFPDRFAKSNRVPKPSNLQEWGAKPDNSSYQGGDLIGVVEHLDYLIDLGINALYLNPIFQSTCNHRYHTHDYFRVDPLLGGNEAFRELIDACHRHGIRIILDGVFNHSGRGFFQFNDILENGPDSPWLDWFIIKEWPIAPYNGAMPANYACWWDQRALPKFNTDNPNVREFLMQVGEFWIREFDIDGWRLDVPEEIKTEGFWEEFRRRIRSRKPDAYIVGEIWHPAEDWLQGDRFDALMNYPFAAAVLAFTASDQVSPTLVVGREYDPYPPINAATFGRRIDSQLNRYDWEVNQVQFNLLGSHDTARLTSLSRGDKTTIKLASLLQMTFPGAPCIYYGDEIGIRGTLDYDQPFRDADARWAFPWQDKDSWDHDLLTHYQRLISLRHKHGLLRHGSYKQLAADGNCFVFARYDLKKAMLVALNTGYEPASVTIDLDSIGVDTTDFQLLYGQTMSIDLLNDDKKLNVPPRGGIVIGPTGD